MFRLANQIPNGTMIGGAARTACSPQITQLNRWFRQGYSERFGTPPTYPAYKIIQAILG